MRDDKLDQLKYFSLSELDNLFDDQYLSNNEKKQDIVTTAFSKQYKSVERGQTTEQKLEKILVDDIRGQDCTKLIKLMNNIVGQINEVFHLANSKENTKDLQSKNGKMENYIKSNEISESDDWDLDNSNNSNDINLTGKPKKVKSPTKNRNTMVIDIKPPLDVKLQTMQSWKQDNDQQKNISKGFESCGSYQLDKKNMKVSDFDFDFPTGLTEKKMLANESKNGYQKKSFSINHSFMNESQSQIISGVENRRTIFLKKKRKSEIITKGFRITGNNTPSGVQTPNGRDEVIPNSRPTSSHSKSSNLDCFEIDNLSNQNISIYNGPTKINEVKKLPVLRRNSYKTKTTKTTPTNELYSQSNKYNIECKKRNGIPEPEPPTFSNPNQADDRWTKRKTTGPVTEELESDPWQSSAIDRFKAPDSHEPTSSKHASLYSTCRVSSKAIVVTKDDGTEMNEKEFIQNTKQTKISSGLKILSNYEFKQIQNADYFNCSSVLTPDESVIDRYLILEKLIVVVDTKGVMKVWSFQDVMESMVNDKMIYSMLNFEDIKENYARGQRITVMKDIFWANNKNEAYFVTGDTKGVLVLYYIEKKQKVVSNLSVKVASSITATTSAIYSMIQWAEKMSILTGCEDGTINIYNWKNLTKFSYIDAHRDVLTSQIFIANSTYQVFFSLKKKIDYCRA